MSETQELEKYLGSLSRAHIFLLVFAINVPRTTKCLLDDRIRNQDMAVFVASKKESSVMKHALSAELVVNMARSANGEI